MSAVTVGPASAAAVRPAIRLAVRDLGRVPYRQAQELQAALAAERREGRGEDTLLLLEHPHVLTLGRNARPVHLLASEAELQRRGVELHSCDRGGDITYHGPGQIVGYPVMFLPEGRRDVRGYVRDLEEALIRTLADLGIAGGREAGLTGVWAGGEKVAAIGVRIARWVTTHGFALNLAPDLSYFSLITPCGIVGRGVTSIERLLGRAPDPAEVKRALARHFQAVFSGGERD